MSNFDLQQIRELAKRKLQHYGKNSGDIRESYLFDDKDFMAGIRYESGPISFLWLASQSAAEVLRGDMLIESVSLVPAQEQRRAA